MSHWNYRVVHHMQSDGTPSGEQDDVYEVHEVYYDDDGGVFLWDPHPARAFGETSADLRDDLAAMLKACDLPILERDDMPGSSTRTDNALQQRPEKSRVTLSIERAQELLRFVQHHSKPGDLDPINASWRYLYALEDAIRSATSHTADDFEVFDAPDGMKGIRVKGEDE